MRVEYKVAFPHLYNSLPRSVHNHKNVHIWTNDPDLPALYFDPLINYIASRSFPPKNVPRFARPSLGVVLARLPGPLSGQAPDVIANEMVK